VSVSAHTASHGHVAVPRSYFGRDKTSDCKFSYLLLHVSWPVSGVASRWPGAQHRTHKDNWRQVGCHCCNPVISIRVLKETESIDADWGNPCRGTYHFLSHQLLTAERRNSLPYLTLPCLTFRVNSPNNRLLSTEAILMLAKCASPI